jgi:N-acetylated-alpha-linked acidic dipeptidase
MRYSNYLNSTIGLIIGFSTTSTATSIAHPAPTIIGFSAERAAKELNNESQFSSTPNAETLAKLSKDLSSHPILVATPQNVWNALYTTMYLRGLGYQPEVSTYYPYLSTPKQISVDIVTPTPKALSVKETPWPWQEHFEDVVVGYNAYSPAGDVTGAVVYVNYGLPEDYEALAQLGVEVQGKIAIARYGRVFRGIKTREAEKRGVIGLILYDDPVEDGFILGNVYPVGPWRTPDGIQRGTIEYLFNYPGDPLTPGWAATKNAARLQPSEADNLPRQVLTTPLGYGEASHILESLDGPLAPTEWQGGLADERWSELGGTPFIYHVGGTAKTSVHMNLNIEYGTKPIHNIVVEIPGSKYPDEMVIVGAHRDGWTYGTSDNTAGFVVLLEMARSFKVLQDYGWRPERTIVLAGWDGEEYGMLGSTEWAEQHQRLLRKNAVAYINIDAGGGGTHFYAAGVPSLDEFIYDVTANVTEPRNGLSVYEDWQAQAGITPPPVERLGSGSDFSVFLNYLGIPVVDFGYWSEGGNYHSSQDDLYSMNHFGDPGYEHQVTTVKLAGIAAMRLACADVLPFKYSNYAEQVTGYLVQLESSQPAGTLNLETEKSASELWRQSVASLEDDVTHLLASGSNHQKDWERRVRTFNNALINQERALLQEKGLPDRSWFKHMIYAPDITNGYTPAVLPALTELASLGPSNQLQKYRQLLLESLRAATNSARSSLTRSAPIPNNSVHPIRRSLKKTRPRTPAMPTTPSTDTHRLVPEHSHL